MYTIVVGGVHLPQNAMACSIHTVMTEEGCMSVPHVKFIATPLIVDLIPDSHAEVSGDFCADSDHCILGMRMWFEWTPCQDRERKGSGDFG